MHRIGRTARRGLGGSAVLFLQPSERQYAHLLESHGLHMELLSLQNLFLQTVTLIPGSAKFKNSDEIAAVILQRRLESVVHGNKFLLGASRQVFVWYLNVPIHRSFVGFSFFRSRLCNSFNRYKSYFQGTIASFRSRRKEFRTARKPFLPQKSRGCYWKNNEWRVHFSQKW